MHSNVVHALNTGVDIKFFLVCENLKEQMKLDSV